MSIAVTCPKCDTRYRTPDELEGKKVTCANCGEAIDVPFPFDKPDPEIEELPLLDKVCVKDRPLPPTPGVKVAKTETKKPAPSKRKSVSVSNGKSVSVVGLLTSLVLALAAGGVFFLYYRDGNLLVGIPLVSVGGALVLLGLFRSVPPGVRYAGNRSGEWRIGGQGGRGAVDDHDEAFGRVFHVVPGVGGAAIQRDRAVAKGIGVPGVAPALGPLGQLPVATAHAHLDLGHKGVIARFAADDQRASDS